MSPFASLPINNLTTYTRALAHSLAYSLTHSLTHSQTDLRATSLTIFFPRPCARRNWPRPQELRPNAASARKYRARESGGEEDLGRRSRPRTPVATILPQVTHLGFTMP